MLEQALRIAPKDPELLVTLGDSCMARKEWRKALRFYDKALRRSRGETEKDRILAKTALAWEKSGNDRKAIREYKHALKASRDPSLRKSLQQKISDLESRER